MHKVFFLSFTFSNGNRDSHYIWNKCKHLRLTPIDFSSFVPVSSLSSLLVFLIHMFQSNLFIFLIICSGEEMETRRYAGQVWVLIN